MWTHACILAEGNLLPLSRKPSLELLQQVEPKKRSPRLMLESMLYVAIIFATLVVNILNSLKNTACLLKDTTQHQRRKSYKYRQRQDEYGFVGGGRDS